MFAYFAILGFYGYPTASENPAVSSFTILKPLRSPECPDTALKRFLQA